MKMTRNIKALLWLQCVVLASCQRPNIVFIIADDLGWNDVGFHNDRVLTPEIDLLAAEGLQLNSSYAFQMCTPSRQALFTGRYPFRDGMHSMMILESDPACSPLDVPFLPARLKDLGYRTHLVGKWHLGSCNEGCRPESRGFDNFMGYLGGTIEHYEYGDEAFDLWKNGEPAPEYIGRHSTDVFTEEALEIIANHDQTDPLYLTISYSAPHYPVQTPQEYEDMYADVENEVRRKFLGMMAHLDDSIGRVRAGIADAGMRENTIIVFTSDNGGHNHYGGNNYPLAGDKCSMWEGGNRVPAVVAGPGVLPGVSQGLFHISDWFPTLLAAAGDESAPVEGSAIDGVSQWGMLSRGEASSREEIVYNIDGDVDSNTCGNAAIRVGRYKLIRGFAGAGTMGQPTMNTMPAEACEALSNPPPECGPIDMTIGLHKDIQFYIALGAMRAASDQSMLRLYDLEDDPTEENDISADFPEKTSELAQRLLDLERQAGVSVNPGSYGTPQEVWKAENGTLKRNWCSLDSLSELRVNSVESIQDVLTSYYDSDFFTKEAPATARKMKSDGQIQELISFIKRYIRGRRFQ